MRRVRRVRRVAEGHIFLSILKTSSILNKIWVLHKFWMTLRIFQNTEGLFCPNFQSHFLKPSAFWRIQRVFSVPIFSPILKNTEGLFCPIVKQLFASKVDIWFYICKIVCNDLYIFRIFNSKIKRYILTYGKKSYYPIPCSYNAIA